MKELEKTLKAFANKRRLAIVQFLKNKKEDSVGEIARVIHLSFRSTSRHLSVLLGADIVEKEQRSSQVFYRIKTQPTEAARKILALL